MGTSESNIYDILQDTLYPVIAKTTSARTALLGIGVEEKDMVYICGTMHLGRRNRRECEPGGRGTDFWVPACSLLPMHVGRAMLLVHRLSSV